MQVLISLFTSSGILSKASFRFSVTLHFIELVLLCIWWRKTFRSQAVAVSLVQLWMLYIVHVYLHFSAVQINKCHEISFKLWKLRISVCFLIELYSDVFWSYSSFIPLFRPKLVCIFIHHPAEPIRRRKIWNLNSRNVYFWWWN